MSIADLVRDGISSIGKVRRVREDSGAAEEGQKRWHYGIKKVTMDKKYRSKRIFIGFFPSFFRRILSFHAVLVLPVRRYPCSNVS
jgi:hypothetical protein